VLRARRPAILAGHPRQRVSAIAILMCDSTGCYYQLNSPRRQFNAETFLAIGAHMDDCEIGAGGGLIQAARAAIAWSFRHPSVERL